MSCYICRSSANLLACPTCQVVKYCGNEHLQQDQGRHNSSCMAANNALSALNIAESQLLKTFPLPAHLVRDASTIRDHIRDVFIPSPLPSWDEHTRKDDYTNALRLLIAAYLDLNTDASRQKAYQLVVEFHYLGQVGKLRGTATEYTIPTLLLMKEDQVCYTYICSRWQRFDRKSLKRQAEARNNYEAVERLLDHEKYKKDVFKELEKGVDVSDGLPDMLFQGTMVLLYFWWLRDLKNLRALSSIENWLIKRLNFDVFTIIQSCILETEVIRERRSLRRKNNNALIHRMESRMKYHFRSGHYMNGSFWGQMLNPTETRRLKSLLENARYLNLGNAVQWGSEEDDSRILYWLYQPFKNTPGAIDYVKRALEENKDGRTTEDEAEEDDFRPWRD